MDSRKGYTERSAHSLKKIKNEKMKNEFGEIVRWKNEIYDVRITLSEITEVLVIYSGKRILLL